MKQVCAVAQLFALAGIITASSAHAAVLFSNGFETNTTDWESTTRVPSGTNGIASASGNYHAEAAPGAKGNPNSDTFGRWGGYNYGAGNNVPTTFQAYSTSIDIYLNVGGGWANDTVFDFDSAVSNAAGGFLRDFVFNAGFYNDGTGLGANTNRFVISASNNSQRGSAFAKNPGRNPIAISTTGWYRFEDDFYNNGGVLAADLKIFDSANTLLNTWTLSDVSDLIAGVGGNRYGWFDTNEFSTLAFDNTKLQTASVAAVPEPLSVAIWPIIALTIGGVTWCRRYWGNPTAG
jgi:hypothetical protein